MSNDVKPSTVAQPVSAPKVLDAATAAKASPSAAAQLPAGDSRREQMKKDFEALEAMQAEYSEKYAPELGAIDPAKLKHVDREIGTFSDKGLGLDGSEVQGALIDYKYYWGEARGNNGMDVEFKKAAGWEIVEGSMPEEQRRRSVDGTRRWGTTILMRIHKEKAAILQSAERRRVLARTEGVSVRLLEEAEKLGVKTHDLTSDATPEYMRQNARAQIAAAEAARSTFVAASRQAGRSGQTRVMAHELAEARFQEALRKGTIPGMPASR